MYLKCILNALFVRPAPALTIRVRRFECGISICFMIYGGVYGGAQSMSVGEDELSAPVAAPERIVKFCGGTGRI
jgi:hypothetical protein